MTGSDERPGDRSGSRPGGDDEATLLARLRELQAAREALPPHSGQDWRGDLDRQIDSLRRRLARRGD